MLSVFFINRPIFSWVMALMFMVAGLLATYSLPIQQYPVIAPPQITISATYPGASAETLDATVTQVIEQNLVGIENLRYFSSVSSADGNSQMTLTFETGTNPDIAQVQTQNKVSEALPRLPSQVQQLGIQVEKSNRSYSLIVAFYSPEGKMSQDDLGDYISANIIEPVGRVKGVGQINAFAPEHSLRIWIKPDRLYFFKLTSLDVLSAVRDQNVQLASGQVGAAPSLPWQQINATITSRSLMTDPEAFRRIILKTNPDGSTVKLEDVARVEVGVENYGSIRRFNRHEAAGFGITLTNEANALESIEALKKRIEELRPTFPEGVEFSFPVDVSPFIRLSVIEVVKTLFIAVILVLLVMYVFLQDWRSVLVPGIAIPIVLLGTVAALAAFGYSINILTLFALVLSIGMLVDDAIVITENVKRAMDENPELDGKEAAKVSMKELWGALVGTTAVIWAVFIPMAFFTGSTGVIYCQFSITVLASMTLSLFIALTFTPSVAGSIMRRTDTRKEHRFFRWFNRLYEKGDLLYGRSLEWFLGHGKISYSIFALITGATIFIFLQIPTGFLPDEDQGRVFAIVEGPPNATFDRMMGTIEKVEDFFLEDAAGAVDSLFSVVGFSFSGRGQNTATAFVNLKDYDKRTGDMISSFDVAEKARSSFSNIPNANIIPVTPPAIPELGRAKGFVFQLVDQGRMGRDELIAARDNFMKEIMKNPKIGYVRLNALKDEPQYRIDLDYQRVKALGLSVQDVNNTLSAAWGGVYVNDYLENSRVKRVFLQGEAPNRMTPEDLSKWFVRNSNGEMVSFSDFAKGSWKQGPPQLQRFDGIPSFELQGEAGANASTGQAMDAIEKLAEKLPKGIGFKWSGLSYEERESGRNVFALYSLSLLAIFLSLAALYESWAIPFVVLSVFPVGIFGAALFIWLGNFANDVYFQVGFLITMGLAAKDAILIVEFARIEMDKGKNLREAALEACKQRLRPILMTSLTFLLGILPLAIASGPGSGAQNAIGTSLLGGITSITLLVIYFAPLFFVGVLGMKGKFFARLERRRK